MGCGASSASAKYSTNAESDVILDGSKPWKISTSSNASTASEDSGSRQASKTDSSRTGSKVSQEGSEDGSNGSEQSLAGGLDISERYGVENSSFGKYGFVQVRKATNLSTGRARAVRCFDKQVCERSDVDKEIKRLNQVDHPNIAKLYDAFEDSLCYYLVTDLCTGGQVSDLVTAKGRLSERKTANIMLQALKTLLYLHDCNFCHRALRPEIFCVQDSEAGLENCQIRIVDVKTICSFKKGKSMKDVVETNEHSSPQLVTGSYSELCDTWSLGSMMYFMLCGSVPSLPGSGAEDSKSSFDHLFTEAAWETVSKPAIKLLKRMLAFQEKDRDDIIDCVHHRWFDKFTDGGAAEGRRLSVRHVESLTQFSQLNVLQKTAMTIIAKSLDEEETKDLREVWNWLDADSSGTLTVTELARGIKSMQESGSSFREKKATADIDVKKLMDSLDVNGDRTLTYTEFIAATLPRKYQKEEVMLKTAFEALDADGSGQIDRKELLEALGDGVSKHLLKVLEQADADGDGQIDFQEFAVMMHAA